MATMYQCGARDFSSNASVNQQLSHGNENDDGNNHDDDSDPGEADCNIHFTN